MQKLTRIISERPGATVVEKWNLCREYLQTRILQSLYALPMGKRLVFHGGTCLRICHGTRRYSEDLDFSLAKGKSVFSLKKTAAAVVRDLQRLGFKAEQKVNVEQTVQKAFVRVEGLIDHFHLPASKNQKLTVKLEVDVSPPRGGVVETFFVSRFDELFPISKYDLPTLFAGKMLALLFRPYSRGRDYYDAVWFLKNKTAGNMAYFVSGVKQAKSSGRHFQAWDDVLREFGKKAELISAKALVADLKPFLEDSAELSWLEKYSEAVKSLLERMKIESF
ncbi:MAG: nucleotidyl transferase AbiEii/AbiGii toxin family protein [Candidatus Aminicenantes bacterium]|nr:nucleotidyl transferase AbiEii/AbiGii toxin family protein [Candidatus Aminicenantes bacterium]